MRVHAYPSDLLAPVVMREFNGIAGAESVGATRVDLTIHDDRTASARIVMYASLSVDEARQMHGVLGRALREAGADR